MIKYLEVFVLVKVEPCGTLYLCKVNKKRIGLIIGSELNVAIENSNCGFKKKN